MMATILFAAAGAAMGAGFGGSVLGLSGAVLGRAIGATFGRLVDQSLLGRGSSSVETGRIERFRLTGASEGTPLSTLWGRMRLGGQVIWAGPFVESESRESVGGKGAPRVTVTRYSYRVSLALALGEGVITRIGRIWADGQEIDPQDITWRLYPGDEDQLPDPAIEADLGPGLAPAYRGIAYVVFEDLDLAPWGNRVPQFSFEVMRPVQDLPEGLAPDLSRALRGVALIPGTGEFALNAAPVTRDLGPGASMAVNVHARGGKTDMLTALAALDEELPACQSVLLVVSWFGGDLRCGFCSLRPKVEQSLAAPSSAAWQVAGLTRATAEALPQIAGRPIYGGTPSDQGVIDTIRALRAAGKSVVFYPFILMDQTEANGLPDPWTGAGSQPHLPWRGRITLSQAPGRAGSPDRSPDAEAEVAAFFGAALPGHFSLIAGADPDGAGAGVAYTGPADDWGYRRFVLHYAHLCQAAGGVDGFCLGSEMRGLTQIRGAGDSFPAVARMRALAGDLRLVLGADCRIGYAADWSEYFGYQTPEGDLRFHLDPLWADENINFIGIDNYMPLADWRDGEDHADAHWGSIHDLAYLQANIEGGEGYDWYYADPAHRAAQIRSPITDGADGEDWIWRYKDLRNWWLNPHHDRVAGLRAPEPSPWQPQSKPFWFTEFGCAAIDKGANEPNKFLDPASSESALPAFSNGRRDDLMQMQYLRAVTDYWADPGRNPVSALYGGAMIDMGRAHAWCWDARPWPAFPANEEAWADGANWQRGHWLTGRVAAQPLDLVVADICHRAGLRAIDVSGLRGVVRGYMASQGGTGRSALQPLMLAYGFDALERDGLLVFRMRQAQVDAAPDPGRLVIAPADGTGQPVAIERLRAAEAELSGRVRLTHIAAEAAYETRTAEASLPDHAVLSAAEQEFPLALIAPEAQAIAARWLAESRVARDGVTLSLPPSLSHLGPGDVLALPEGHEGRDPSAGLSPGRYRIDRAELAGDMRIEALRIEPGIYQIADEAEARVVQAPYAPPAPVLGLFLDLPLLREDAQPHAPHMAVTATPWPGAAALYSALSDAGYVLNTEFPQRAMIGQSLTPLAAAAPGRWDRGPALAVRFAAGALASVSPDEVLAGAGLFAIGTGAAAGWEVFQAAQAVLIAPETYALGLRLRGQAGSEVDMAAEWPVGSWVVRLDGALRQIALRAEERGLARHYRLGSAFRGYDDPSFSHRIEAFAGIGLRPLAPCHLRWRRDGAGGGLLGWVRRSRIEGDQWDNYDIPLGEAFEAYLLRVSQGGVLRREVSLTSPAWAYTAAQIAADLAPGPFEIAVAQMSDRFGPGAFERIVINE